MSTPVFRLLALAAALAQSACLVSAPSSGGSGGGGYVSRPPPSGVPAQDEIQIAAAAVNRNRGSCPPLQWDAAAARVAQAHSDGMARARVLTHQLPGEPELARRLAAQGVSISAAAENVGSGYAGGEEVVRGWMASPGHRRNIQWCDVTRMGLGARDGYWTLVVYAPGR